MKLEKLENEKFKKEIEGKIKSKIDGLYKKHLLEKSALKLKADNEIDVMKKQKDLEIEKYLWFYFKKIL